MSRTFRVTLSTRDWLKAGAIGIAVSILTAALMLAAKKAGVSPLPKPLGLAFAETLLGTELPLPVGLLFHTAWVTTFSVLYIVAFRNALSFWRALSLAAALWAIVLLVFYPIVGWGAFGLAVGRMLIVGSAVPHLLFAVFLWGLCRLAFSSALPGPAYPR